MHGEVHDLFSLLIVFFGSFMMPALAARIRVPAAVLLIGYGVMIGPALLGLVADDPVLGFLYEIGFIVLMFLAGMEIDFNRIRHRGPRALAVVFAVCLAIFGCAFWAASLLGLHPIFGLALGATSVGLPLAILRETGQLRTPLGQTVVLVGSVGEFLSVIGMTIFYFATRHGFSFELLIGIAKLVALLAVAAITLRALMALAWWRPARFSRFVAEREASEIGVRAAFLLMIGFSLLALLAGLESIIGAFVAGAVIAFVLRGKEVLEEKLAAVGHGLFIPVFFVLVGLRFDPHTVSRQALATAGSLMLAAFAVRLGPCLALYWQGLAARQVVATVTLLSAPLTLVVAIAAIGHELAVIDDSGAGTLILLAVSAGALFPILFRLLAARPDGATE